MTTAIVVTYDSSRWMRACLTALRGTPTIVVDNASRDDTVALVRREFPEVRVIPRPDNRGYAVAVNEGCRAVPNEDVIILNPDLVAPPGSIAVLEAYLAANPRVGIAGPRLMFPDGTIHHTSPFAAISFGERDGKPPRASLVALDAAIKKSGLDGGLHPGVARQA